MNSISVPEISAHYRKILNEPITSEEVEKAIDGMKSGKLPGPDGISSKFYKSLKKEISPKLQFLMNEVMTNHEIPETWNQASITLIPKDKTDTMEVRNFRPISLLNLDYKVFAKVLAERIKLFLIDFISEEQTGFLPQRHLKDNIRTVIDIIEYYDKNPGKEVALIFLDAEKSIRQPELEISFVPIRKNEDWRKIFKCNNNIPESKSIFNYQLGQYRIFPSKKRNLARMPSVAASFYFSSRNPSKENSK